MGKHHGILFFRVAGDELHQGAGRAQPQLHAAFQMECAGAVTSRRQLQHTAAGCAQSVDGLLQLPGLRLLRFGPEQDMPWPDLRRPDQGEDLAAQSICAGHFPHCGGRRYFVAKNITAIVPFPPPLLPLCGGFLTLCPDYNAPRIGFRYTKSRAFHNIFITDRCAFAPAVLY